MPATEKTWRDQKWMHVVFGVSSLIMLVTTVWMFAKDHNREWRSWQLKDRGKEKWALTARLAESSAETHGQLLQLKADLAATRSAMVDPSLIDQFKEIVRKEDQRLTDEGSPPKTVSLDQLDDLLGKLKPLAEEAAQKRAEIPDAQAAAREAMTAKLDAEADEVAADIAKDTNQEARAKLHALQQADQARDKAEDKAAAARNRLLREMDGFIKEAKRREDAFTAAKKFAAADHTAVVSELGLKVSEGVPANSPEVVELQKNIDGYAADITDLDAKVAAANDYRIALESIQGEITGEQDLLQKELGAVQGDLDRLKEALVKNGRPTIFGSETLGKTWEAINRGPILDALYDGNIRIEQTWLPDITINYNFSSVPRYDRCITCHRSIDKSAPGSAVDPAYPNIPEGERHPTITLATPDQQPEVQVTDEGEVIEPSLESVYGFTLAPTGQIKREAVTVEYVLPKSLAAQAGLKMGDIIQSISGGTIYEQQQVELYLLRAVDWGTPLELVIERGLPNPFTTHPRLDLFVGSLSPHKLGDMGCTICHDGQGSATAFMWASHTPNDPQEALEWSRQYGWFDNHHWIFPMTAERFVESNCLKCHYEVVDLEPSERFPDPPAPKLVKGYHLIKDYGCYGCHEINGYDGPTRRVGPDLRLEPNYHEVAAAILRDKGLDDQERRWASEVISTPDSVQARHQLMRAINLDSKEETEDEGGRLSPETQTLADLLKDVDAPGQLRKVGPSLRYLKSKVQYEWLYSWIRKPADFRPSTRMPQFFGLHQHLEPHRKEFPNAQGEAEALTDKEMTSQFEAIEIRALTEFLLANSSDFVYLDQPQEVTELPSAERGKWLFESRGCLACHSQKEFTGIHSDQGPDLSRLAAKFNSGKGQRWLYSWLKQPQRYHPRTVMPNLYLDPIVEVDANGEPTGKVTDPAADIMEYLVNVPTDWKPTDVPSKELTAEDQAVLTQLTTEWLASSFPRRRAAVYATEGIPMSQVGVKGDEQVLVRSTEGNDPMPEDELVQKQLEYVARRSISRYGCFGCHDIPGYESAKPIGTALTEWGRKEPAKLAFENIGTYLASHGVHEEEVEVEQPAVAQTDPAHEGHGDEHGHAGEGGGHHGLDPLEFDDDTGYYLQALNSHQRQGFIWQKLREPRSYDYEKTRNKRYDERLRMPKFPLNAEDREAIITFVLGLVNEAPNEKYVYKPEPRMKAIVEGRPVLEKYNCGGCHVLDMERWQFAIEPYWFDEPPEQPEFPFLEPDPSEADIEASLQTNNQGLLNVTLHGLPVFDQETGKPSIVDEDGVPLEPDDDESDPFYEFTLYRNAVVAGAVRQVGVQNLLIPANREGYGPARGHAYPTNGGDLAKYLFAPVIREEKKSNPQANGAEAWGWLPPPLIDEGRKVQTGWLHDFLMDPHKLRPAVVMRMPNFNMSTDEASKLVDYFAAKDDASWPYEYNERRRADYLASLEGVHPARMDDAMKIVTDGNYCVKCHAVGDYEPKGAIKTQGPQLGIVYERLRTDYVRNWIANPKKILPYTGMPVNIPYMPEGPHYGGVSQQLFPGTSIQQLDGLVDLLMNFDEYAKRQTTIKSMVKEVPAEGAGEQASETTQPDTSQSALR